MKAKKMISQICYCDVCNHCLSSTVHLVEGYSMIDCEYIEDAFRSDLLCTLPDNCPLEDWK